MLGKRSDGWNDRGWPVQLECPAGRLRLDQTAGRLPSHGFTPRSDIRLRTGVVFAERWTMQSDSSIQSRPIMPQTIRRRPAMCALSAAGFLALLGLSRRTSAGEAALLRIGGTGMALATMRQIGAEFVATRPDVAIKVLPSLGTGGGLAAVADAAIGIALSARTLNDAERAKGLRILAYGRTPIAFVSSHVGRPDITLSQVAAILTGSTLAWPDGTPIRLVRREPSDADWTLLRGLSADMAAAVTVALSRVGLLTVATDQDNADALERLTGSFGMISLGQMRAENRKVVPFSLDDEAPEVAAIAAGRYKLSRTLYVVWRDPPTPEVAGFLTFLRSQWTNEMLVRLGHIPLAGAAA
jgi:phosphate transport system substrate-binding protein